MIGWPADVRPMPGIAFKTIVDYNHVDLRSIL